MSKEEGRRGEGERGRGKRGRVEEWENYQLSITN
jgi:hypothetical protein